MLSQEQKKELTRQRLNLRARIREAQNKGKNVDNLVTEYNELLKELKSKGLEIDYRMYLDYTGPINEPKQKNTTTSTTTTIKSQTNLKQKNTTTSTPTSTIEDKPHILNIAWTESGKGTDINTLTELDNYLKTISEADIYDDSTDDRFEIEHIIKYKFKTNKQAFNVIKQSAQYIKDKIADSSKDSIEIFGKCLGPS